MTWLGSNGSVYTQKIKFFCENVFQNSWASLGLPSFKKLRRDGPKLSVGDFFCAYGRVKKMSEDNKIALVEGNETCKDVCLYKEGLEAKKKEKKPKVTVDTVSCGLVKEQGYISGTPDIIIRGKGFPGRNRLLLQYLGRQFNFVFLEEELTKNEPERVCCGIVLEKYWRMCPKCGKDVPYSDCNSFSFK
jgi:hypothetical protein